MNGDRPSGVRDPDPPAEDWTVDDVASSRLPGTLADRFRDGNTWWVRYSLAVLGVALLSLVMLPVRDELGVLNITLLFLILAFLIGLSPGSGPAVVGALLAFLALNFIFILPYYTFTVADPDHLLGLFVYLGVALVSSLLVARLRATSEEAVQQGKRTTLLYDLNRALVADVTLAQVLQSIVKSVVDVYGAAGSRIVVAEDDDRLDVRARWPTDMEATLDRQAQAMARWAIEHRSPAGISDDDGKVAPAGTVAGVADRVGLPTAKNGLLPKTRPGASGDAPGSQPKRSLFDPQIVGPALAEAFRKLDPRHVARNPVMLIVEIGALIMTLILLADLAGVADSADVEIEAGGHWFAAWITAWLWFTVLFANFAEAMAEGRGKAQADSLRKTRTGTMAKVRVGGTVDQVGQRIEERVEERASSDLHLGDIVLIETNDIIPSDGEVIEGVAFVSEAAITGESAPVLKEPGTDTSSSVTGGTQVVSDSLKIRITAEPGQTFLDRMIALVEGAKSLAACSGNAGSMGQSWPRPS